MAVNGNMGFRRHGLKAFFELGFACKVIGFFRRLSYLFPLGTFLKPKNPSNIVQGIQFDKGLVPWLIQ
ncbi:Putative protein [Zobellia galactanivorans]|uniref:Uncharacterized protein n=1 Tax=Zobellia galactanivorans (strain DSM 12802 / CCUG 47099 / CIP 106680 / NCIMB 13871 / Dsij) TaxID=63186 RepID=G0KZF5_ZOBGA|nr:Putative protein [Zobellia galactanivorans]